MGCIIACGLLANHGIVKGGEMSPKVEDTVSITKKITDSQWLSNNSDTLEAVSYTHLTSVEVKNS